jgi:hypothetical protein
LSTAGCYRPWPVDGQREREKGEGKPMSCLSFHVSLPSP